MYSPERTRADDTLHLEDDATIRQLFILKMSQMQLRAQIEREKAQQAAQERKREADALRAQERTLVRRAKSPSSELPSCIVDPWARRGYCSGSRRSDRTFDTFETGQSEMVEVHVCAVQAMLNRAAQLMTLINKKSVQRHVSQLSTPNDEHVESVSLRAPSNSIGTGETSQRDHGAQAKVPQHEALRGRLVDLQDKTNSVTKELEEKLEAVRMSHGQVKALQVELAAVEHGKRAPPHQCLQRGLD